MLELCFATNNQNKLSEIRQMLGKTLRILSLHDINCREEDIPENQKTLEGNSLEKAWYIYDKYGLRSFADDTGLEVDALNGEPGVYSARYAGPQKNNSQNIALLLEKLNNAPNRKARFRTVITLFLTEQPLQFEGIVNGMITDKIAGDSGFGYDPVFIPEGYQKTFAQLSMAEKNRISHRGFAFRKLVDYVHSKPGLIA